MKSRYPAPKQPWETFGSQRQKAQNQVRAIQSAMVNKYKATPKKSKVNSLIKPLPKLKKISSRRKSGAPKLKKIKPIRSPK